MKSNNGFEWLRKGHVKGKILGGCLSSIVHLRGTKYWPDFNNKILFIEIPEGEDFDKGECLHNVDAFLCDLRLSNVFDKIKGLIVGRPFRYNIKEVKKFKQIILENTKDYKFPILYRVDIGHTDPQITIPLNVEVEIRSKDNMFEFLEAGVC